MSENEFVCEAVSQWRLHRFPSWWHTRSSSRYQCRTRRGKVKNPGKTSSSINQPSRGNWKIDTFNYPNAPKMDQRLFIESRRFFKVISIHLVYFGVARDQNRRDLGPPSDFHPRLLCKTYRIGSIRDFIAPALSPSNCEYFVMMAWIF